MAEAHPRLVCVVVNWNGYADTIQCLDSLRAQDYPNLGVVVVDNGSSNDSAARIQAAHSWVTFHQLPVNVGFPSGCNAGTRLAYHAGADYIWLLNNDTVAPPDTASAIMRAALANPGAGAIGCVLYYMHATEQVQAWGGGQINLTSAYVSHFHAPADFSPENTFFTGASLTFPRSICTTVGIFFEGFFMYCDDSDLCLRIHRAGYPLAMAANTAILHKEGGSRPKESPFTDRFATTSTMRLLRRSAPVPAFSIALYVSLRLLNRLRRRQWENLAAVWQGVLTFFRERDSVFTDQL